MGPPLRAVLVVCQHTTVLVGGLAETLWSESATVMMTLRSLETRHENDDMNC